MSGAADNAEQPWTIIRLLEWTRGYFASKGIDDARLEAELLLAHALGAERVQLYAQHDRVLAEAELSAFRDLVRRRAQRAPTQYLLGKAHFRNLTLKVTPAVLVPRPETDLFGHGHRTQHHRRPAQTTFAIVVSLRRVEATALDLQIRRVA